MYPRAYVFKMRDEMVNTVEQILSHTARSLFGHKKTSYGKQHTRHERGESRLVERDAWSLNAIVLLLATYRLSPPGSASPPPEAVKATPPPHARLFACLLTDRNYSTRPARPINDHRPTRESFAYEMKGVG